MTLPPSGYHARAVTFGCMAKGKGISSRVSLLIFMKVLVGNVVISGHHAKAVSFGYPLSKKKKKKKKKIKETSKKMNKGKNWLGKNTSMTGTARLLQRHPHITLCILVPHCTHMSGHPLATSPHLHGLDEIFLETFLFLWTLAQ
jgi:hypothetical protein